MIRANVSCSVADMANFLTGGDVIGECADASVAKEVLWNFSESILGAFVQEPWMYGCPGTSF